MMTRIEFERFAATLETTDGFTAAQLEAINNHVFYEVAELDVDASATKSIVDHAFARAFDVASGR